MLNVHVYEHVVFLFLFLVFEYKGRVMINNTHLFFDVIGFQGQSRCLRLARTTRSEGDACVVVR